jgi:hypothetical protein
MPDVNSIPFRQASGNGHYESKQLPNDKEDFLAILGLPPAIGNVTSVTSPSLDGQLATFWGTSGLVVKGSTAIGLVNLVDGVVTTKTTPAGEIVGTTAVQTLSNKTIQNSTVTGITGITKADVGLGNVDNTSDANKPVSAPQQLALDLKEDDANKGIANGYAGLDATGKVPLAQLPATVQGAMIYQGTWNAATNVPIIPVASATNKGWYYVVSVAGTMIISGVSSWDVGDWLVSNGVAWNKVDNTDTVSSVAGRTGDVVLTKTDVGLANVDNTSDATKNSAPVTLTNKTINGANNILTARLESDVSGNLGVSHLNGGIGATTQTWWCGNGEWRTPGGAGDTVGPNGAIDSQIALFDGVTGKLLKASSSVPNVSVPTAGLVDGAVTADKASPGMVVQTQYAISAAWAGTTASMPLDDTIPQSGEGALIVSLSFTPKLASSLIRVRGSGAFASNHASAGTGTVALFQSGSANAVAASGLNFQTPVPLQERAMEGYFLPGSVTPLTISMRAGMGTGAGTYWIYWNGSSSARLLGGSGICVLSVEEIRQ